MQQKVNSVRIKVGSEEVELKDVVMLRGSEGLYVETSEKIGTDNEGKDLHAYDVSLGKHHHDGVD